MKWSAIVIMGFAVLLIACIAEMLSHDEYVPSEKFPPSSTFPILPGAYDVTRGSCYLYFTTRDSVDDVLAFYAGEGFKFTNEVSWWGFQREKSASGRLTIHQAQDGYSQFTINASMCHEGLSDM